VGTCRDYRFFLGGLRRRQSATFPLFAALSAETSSRRRSLGGSGRLLVAAAVHIDRKTASHSA